MKTFLFCGLAALALALVPPAARADVNCLRKSVTFDLRSAYTGEVIIDSARRVYLTVAVNGSGDGSGTLTFDPNTVKGIMCTAVAVTPIRVKVELVKDEKYTVKGRRVYKLTRDDGEGERAKGEGHWLLVVPTNGGSAGSLVFLDQKGKFRDSIALEPVPASEVRPLEVFKDDFKRPQASKPKLIVIGSAEELAKADVFRDDDGRAAVAKLMDFKKEKLVLFVWKGSNTDKVSDWRLTPGTVTFLFSVGHGEDAAHMQVRAFTVPKNTPVEFGETRTRTGIEEWWDDRLPHILPGEVAK